MDTTSPPPRLWRRGQRALVGFALLFSLWLVFDGAHDWTAGLFAAGLAAILAAAFSGGPAHPWRPFRLPSFALFFLFESFRGGIDVAWRSLHPRMPVRPRFFVRPMTLPDGPPSTLLISVISLLPGTLSAELRPTTNELVVHTLTEGGEAAVNRLEQRIAWLFNATRPEQVS